MIIRMLKEASEAQATSVVDHLETFGYRVHVNRTIRGMIIGTVSGDGLSEDCYGLRSLPGVQNIMSVTHPFVLASRQMHPEPTIVRLGEVAIGGWLPTMIADYSSADPLWKHRETARAMKRAGIHLLRGGVFVREPSPYFQGLDVVALQLLHQVAEETGLLVVIEVTSTEDVETVARYADLVQVGAGQMQHYPLLRRLGAIKAPVLLQRAHSATIEEWLLAAEYLLVGGNQEVVLCETGIRSFETYTRNTLDLSAVAVVNQISHLPIIVGPSQATGCRTLVAPMSRAALAAGAAGLMIEVSAQPESSLPAGRPSLSTAELAELMKSLEPVTEEVSVDP